MGIHPLIDIRLWEKTGEDRNLSFAKNLVAFAAEQKEIAENEFDPDRDKMIIVFDGDVFEEKVQGYEELVQDIEKSDIAAVTNPGFELFLLLHLEGSYEKYIKGQEAEFLNPDAKHRYSHAYKVLLEATGMNAKKNAAIGHLAEHVMLAIQQERLINQDVHQIKGKISSNVGLVIETIIKENPDI